jgi:hypothetical protein
MRWNPSLAIVATSLVLAATAAAQTPGIPATPGPTPGNPGSTTPGQPGSTTPSMPGSTKPSTPGSTTPGMPGSTTPGTPGSATPGSPTLNNPSGTNPTFPCPPGQGRRPGSTACTPR